MVPSARGIMMNMVPPSWSSLSTRKAGRYTAGGRQNTANVMKGMKTWYDGGKPGVRGVLP